MILCGGRSQIRQSVCQQLVVAAAVFFFFFYVFGSVGLACSAAWTRSNARNADWSAEEEERKEREWAAAQPPAEERARRVGNRTAARVQSHARADTEGDSGRNTGMDRGGGMNRLQAATLISAGMLAMWVNGFSISLIGDLSRRSRPRPFIFPTCTIPWGADIEQGQHDHEPHLCVLLFAASRRDSTSAKGRRVRSDAETADRWLGWQMSSNLQAWCRRRIGKAVSPHRTEPSLAAQRDDRIDRGGAPRG